MGTILRGKSKEVPGKSAVVAWSGMDRGDWEGKLRTGQTGQEQGSTTRAAGSEKGERVRRSAGDLSSRHLLRAQSSDAASKGLGGGVQ